MTDESPHPNRNQLWGETLIDELVASGVSVACVAPGSRSTPLVVALDAHPDVQVHSHLDERAAGFFALGRAKRSGEPTALVSTSGTATANFHPAVIEASQARVPLVALTADRPPELWDSGANQTVDQRDLYGSATRLSRTLPEPSVEPRALRSLRTTACRAVAAANGVPPGPVHLNVPFRKPLAPVEVPGDVPADLAEEHHRAVAGRDGPYVTTSRGDLALPASALADLADAVTSEPDGLIVCGPTTEGPGPESVAALAEATGYPVVADPLSGVRFHAASSSVAVGGYDAYLHEAVTEDWPDPGVVLRFGASPTSKALRQYLAGVDARQFLVDPAGEWREATFVASDLLEADPDRLARALADRLGRDERGRLAERVEAAEARYWSLLADRPLPVEAATITDVLDATPTGSTLVVSNSTPVRDLDRFGRPRPADLTVLGNRGASGIDGVTSTALGAASATDDPLVCVIGDLAFYHDLTGLLAIQRCDVDATVVLVNNDGGGIFEMLPIADFDPPFTDQFLTPHGLDFAPAGDLFGFDFLRVETGDELREACAASARSVGTQVIEVRTDAAESHRERETLRERVVAELA